MAKWKLVSKHEYEFIAAFPRYVMTLVALFVGLLMTAGGAALLIFGTDWNNVSNLIPALIFGVLLVVFGLLIACGSVFFWPWKPVRWVRVYEEGLRWQAGGREHKCRWEEVTQVNRTEMNKAGAGIGGSDWSRTAFLTLRLADGTGVSFDPTLTGYDTLARRVQEAVAVRQLAGAAAELDDAGKTFGLVHVSRKGVTAEGRFFAWKEVKWLAVYNGELCAHPDCTTWRPVPLSGISDYLVLLSLLKARGRFHE
jgi:hypothetical protein